MAQNHKAKILTFFTTHKRMPNISEIMTLCRLKSRSSAFYVAEQLVTEGVVEKDASGKLIPTSKLHEVHKVGRVRAGFAAPAEEELADTISIGEYLLENKEASFLLQIEGDSMTGAGLLEGDVVIFERGRDAKPGDIVIALTEDGYTIKYLRQVTQAGKKARKLYLEAANPAYPNIYPKDGQIIGVVTATFRKYI